MREIKFRAFSERIGMFNVDVLSITEGIWDCGGHIDGKRRQGISIAAQPHLKLMQYTGLKDKNGVEIYEGDVFEYTLPASSEHDKETIYTEEVHFINGSFELDNCPLGAFCEYGIVIGNTYTNPELITTP